MKTEIWVVFVKNKELYSMWCNERYLPELGSQLYYVGDFDQSLWELVKASRRGEYAPR